MTDPTPQTPPDPRPRVLSGMRPTGRLHLGNYLGALYNWVQLQAVYDCFFFIADYHALTTDYADPSRLQENIREVALDFLSAGLDPATCTMFVQSHVPQHAELNLLFSMFTPLSWLERVPTYKDQQEQLREKDLATYGFLGYPLLQSADILLYQPDFVPVGQDQVAHVELTREIARRFNSLYPLGKEGVVHVRGRDLTHEQAKFLREQQRLIEPDQMYTFHVGLENSEFRKVYVFEDPKVLLTPSPKLPGIDGRKMSKSYGNTIMLTDQPLVVYAKMEAMSNGGQRPTQSIPGNPEICPVGDMHRLFSSPLEVDEIETGCREALIGCLNCKMRAGQSINEKMVPIRNKRSLYESDMEAVIQILAEGAEKASERADQTMLEVRQAMGMSKGKQGKRFETVWHRFFDSLPNGVVHDLAANKEWWDLAPEVRAQNLRTYWLEKALPTEIALKRDSERVFITSHNKRVYVTTSREDRANTWDFYAVPKSYEMLAVLCWDKSFRLHSFVIPQKAYVEAWSAHKKKDPKAKVHFQVHRNGENFDFQLDGQLPVDISTYQSNFELLR